MQLFIKGNGKETFFLDEKGNEVVPKAGDWFNSTDIYTSDEIAEILWSVPGNLGLKEQGISWTWYDFVVIEPIKSQKIVENVKMFTYVSGAGLVARVDRENWMHFILTPKDSLGVGYVVLTTSLGTIRVRQIWT